MCKVGFVLQWSEVKVIIATLALTIVLVHQFTIPHVPYIEVTLISARNCQMVLRRHMATGDNRVVGGSPLRTTNCACVCVCKCHENIVHVAMSVVCLHFKHLGHKSEPLHCRHQWVIQSTEQAPHFRVWMIDHCSDGTV